MHSRHQSLFNWPQADIPQLGMPAETHSRHASYGTPAKNNNQANIACKEGQLRNKESPATIFVASFSWREKKKFHTTRKAPGTAEYFRPLRPVLGSRALPGPGWLPSLCKLLNSYRSSKHAIGLSGGSCNISGYVGLFPRLLQIDRSTYLMQLTCFLSVSNFLFLYAYFSFPLAREPFIKVATGANRSKPI